MTAADVARLSIREVDQRLLSLRETLFGGSVSTVVDCPLCGTKLEACFESAQILPTTLAPERALEEQTEMTVGAFKVRCRPVNASDMLALEGIVDPIVARQRVLDRCVLTAWREDKPVATHDLSPEDQDVLVEAITGEQVAPAEVTLACVECRRSSQFAFDIAAFLWTELDAWARRMLTEVHLLARAYGWSEATILSLSADRRATYLSMVSQ
jgi:hypothetical protein